MKQNLCTKLVKLMVGLALATCLPAMLPAQSLRWLGVLPAGESSFATGVSADGSVVVGRSDPNYRAFRWTRATGIQNLGTLGGNWSEARDISADGTVIAGFSYTDWYFRAARWTAFTGWENLGDIPNVDTEGYGISGDGTVIVGYAYAPYFWRAFRWHADTGLQDIGVLSGGFGASAQAASWNGSVIVGTAISSTFQWVPFRWSELNGMIALTMAPGEAKAVSSDGSVVVGFADTVSGRRPFRWTATSGAIDLGSEEFALGAAYDLDGSGAIAVGAIWNTNETSHAARWLEVVENLNTVYAHALSAGDHLQSALSISHDGRYIVGVGRNASLSRTEAFLLDTWRTADTNGDGCIDDQDLLAVLFAFGTAGSGLTRHEDINKDGTVDDADLLSVLFNFGC